VGNGSVKKNWALGGFDRRAPCTDASLMSQDHRSEHGAVPPDPLSGLPGIREARAMVYAMDSWTVEVQKELTAIPAPSFEEGPRGERMAELFREAGLTGVRVDEVGNVLAQGRLPPKSPFVISAHLDTVFPPGTDVTPRTVDALIRAPGIADDGRGLAALLTLGRVLSSVELPLPFPVLFVATVGEEGIGNLRGVRHLFRNGGPGSDARGFISLDGVGLDRIIARGVGSTRLRVTVRGPGGHSWTDWGLPNPIHALGRIVASLEELPLPSAPRTTATVARWGGGRSINSIPQEAWVEVDLRSEGSGALERLAEAFSRRCEVEVTRTRSPEGEAAALLEMEITELGRRPAGTTPPESPLVRAAIQATRACGVEPQLASSSTDANVPMALGIPAITLGAGGKAGGIHTLDEWYSNSKGPEGILRALYTLLLSG
jgi:tripeptide aminopeptidase